MYNEIMRELLPTKFYFPPLPVGFIARPQLWEKLDQALDHRLILVSAPAGAGKTTLVSGWIQSTRKKGAAFGWLSLDEADNDLGRFLEYLAGCLEEGGTVIDIEFLSTAQGRTVQMEDALAQFIRGLMDLKQDVILVLDDYHLIQNPQIHNAVQYFLDYASPRLHLLILTRSDPPLELARYRLSGQLGEIRMEHLQFSILEAAEFLNKSANLSLTEEQVSVLNGHAEGWIAGLQMAAISLQGMDAPSAFIAAFAGSRRYVFDYLVEQILDRQPAEVREFLLETSILERLSPALCDAVTGKIGESPKMLNLIEHSNLFLVSLDDEHKWYRYHHLFSALLRLILEQTHPELLLDLHHRACLWYKEHGLLADSLHHGLASGNMELVARIVFDNVLVLVENSEILPILAQINSIPLEQRKSLPWLELAHAWGLTYLGHNDQAASIVRSVEEHIGTLAEEERKKLQGHFAAVRAYITWTDGDHEEAVKLAEQAEALLPENEIAVRALNLTTLGNALIQIKDDSRSAGFLEQALGLANQLGQSHVSMLVVSGLAYTYAVLGRFREARQVCKVAIDSAEIYLKQNGRPLTASACVYAPMTRICLEAGEFEQALHYAMKGVALSDLWGQVDTIMICRLFLANTLAVLKQEKNCMEVIQQAQMIAEKAPPWHKETIRWAELEFFLDGDPQDRSAVRKVVAHLQKMGYQISKYLLARALIKQGQPAEAIPLLDQCITDCCPATNYKYARLHILKALAYFQLNDFRSSLNNLDLALRMGATDDRLTSFIREGNDMEKLLHLAYGRTSEPEFLRKVLAGFAACKKYQARPLKEKEALIESLSEREMEVLQHLNSYLSIPEIASLLVVSANTVRTHVKNIYGKFEVHGRSGAIRRATELGLLS
jgi:LuxR family transcriptional regulator, maltose regulon positive regulatory protein